MTQTPCCATPHRTHSYHTAPNSLCGFFIPPVKQLFISPSLASLNPSLPHTCFIFSPTPTSLCFIVSITLLCLHEYFYGFVFLKKNTILHIAYCGCYTCISTLHSGCINVSQDFGCIQRITARSKRQRCAIQTGSKHQRCLSHLSTLQGCSDSEWRLFPSVALECMTSSQRNGWESAS